jgi:signal peptidase II
MSEPTTPFRESGLRWWWLAAIMIVLDQLTKAWIVEAIPFRDSVYVLPVLNIIHTTNPGAAWSFAADAGGIQRWIFSGLAIAVSLGLIWWLRRLALATHSLLSAGLTLILGGAIGNVIDRLRIGEVVDFVDVHWGLAHFPAFNVADSAISIGAACVILDAIREWQRERQLKREAASTEK